MGLFDTDDRQQSLFAALLAASPQLMAAGAPSTQPGGVGRGIAAFGPTFVQTQQGYLGNQQNMALRALQMKKMQEDLAQQENWRRMWEQSSGASMFGLQGGAMTAPDPADGSVGGMFGQPKMPYGVEPGAAPLIAQLGPKAGAQYLLKSQYGQPSNIQEWNEFNKMTPEQQRSYLTMKRAMPNPLNLGDRYAQPDPSTPGNIIASYPKGIPPEQQPALKGEQEKQKTIGGVAGKREANMSDIGEVIDRAESLLSGSETGTHPTGSLVGSLYDTAAGVFGGVPSGAKEADALRAVSGSLVAMMPRMEGPQSDKDTMLYREMAGQVGNDAIPVERRKFALNEVKRLWAKYGKSGQSTAPTEYDYVPGRGLVPRGQ